MGGPPQTHRHRDQTQTVLSTAPLPPASVAPCGFFFFLGVTMATKERREPQCEGKVQIAPILLHLFCLFRKMQKHKKQVDPHLVACEWFLSQNSFRHGSLHTS